MKKIFFLCLLLLTFPLPAFALRLQLDWPRITLPGIGTFDLETTTRLHDVARYFYYSFVILGGIVGFIGLLIGGIRRLTSAGNPEAISQSKRQIQASFLGLLIILFSWLILYTIDPQLVIFHIFPEAVPIPPLPGYTQKELEDGIIFYVANHPFLTRIEVPGGLIHVEDTRQFPVGDTYTNLWGGTPCTGPLCGPLDVEYLLDRSLPHISEIEIRPHSGLTGPLENQSRYGVACFEKPHFRGRLRVFIPPLRDANFNIHSNGRVPFVIPSPLAHNIPCGSILVFKIAQTPIAKKWNILFYQYPFPEREKKNPLTLEKEIIGDCIDYYIALQTDNCSRHTSMLDWSFNYLSGDDLLPGGFMEEICHSLQSVDASGNFWYPRSMELPKGEGSMKYLIFLLQEDNGRVSRHWDEGDAYYFISDVDDFLDEKQKDDRIYWKNLPHHITEEILPKSCIIIPVREVY